VDAFFDELLGVRLPPTWVAELEVAGENSGVKMRGCGLVTINPPWQLDREITQWLPYLAQCLAQGPGATASLRWLVPE
nr:23S rRNA (adenine(2030)-N(6))-methyltransferase RlmJ [Opitutaceae bacterium]